MFISTNGGHLLNLKLTSHLHWCSSPPSNEHIVVTGGLLLWQSMVTWVRLPSVVHSSNRGSTAGCEYTNVCTHSKKLCSTA